MDVLTEIAKAWDANADAWAGRIASGEATLRRLVHDPAFYGSFVPNLAGKEVIDLGCGEGHSSRQLARTGARVTGIDLSQRLIEKARAREVAEPLGIGYRVGSFTALTEIADESFDAAVSAMAFMDSPDFPAAAREAYRVLRPGGGLAFSVIHPCFWTADSKWTSVPRAAKKARLLFGYWDTPFIPREGLPTPRFSYRLENYINALCDAGFRLEQIAEPRASETVIAEEPGYWGLRQLPFLLFCLASKA